MFNIRYANHVEKDLRYLPREIVERLLNKIETVLKENPFAGAKLDYRGKELYKYRVSTYRIVYTVNTEQKAIVIYRIRHRKEVYRGL